MGLKWGQSIKQNIIRNICPWLSSGSCCPLSLKRSYSHHFLILQILLCWSTHSNVSRKTQASLLLGPYGAVSQHDHTEVLKRCSSLFSLEGDLLECGFTCDSFPRYKNVRFDSNPVEVNCEEWNWSFWRLPGAILRHIRWRLARPSPTHSPRSGSNERPHLKEIVQLFIGQEGQEKIREPTEGTNSYQPFIVLGWPLHHKASLEISLTIPPVWWKRKPRLRKKWWAQGHRARKWQGYNTPEPILSRITMLLLKCLGKEPFIFFLSFFFLFGYTEWLTGFPLPEQGLNPGHARKHSKS